MYTFTLTRTVELTATEVGLLVRIERQEFWNPSIGSELDRRALTSLVRRGLVFVDRGIGVTVCGKQVLTQWRDDHAPVFNA